MGEGRSDAAVGPGEEKSIKRDLVFESHIQAVSIWFRINGVLMWLLAFGILYYIRVKFDLSPEKVSGLKIGVIASLGWGVFLFSLGHFLGRYSSGALTVARILTILFMLFCLYIIIGPRGMLDRSLWMGVVFATVFLMGFMALGVLLRNFRTAALFEDDYRALVRNRQDERPATTKSPFFWAPIITFVVMIGIGAVRFYIMK